MAALLSDNKKVESVHKHALLKHQASSIKHQASSIKHQAFGLSYV